MRILLLCLISLAISACSEPRDSKFSTPAEAMTPASDGRPDEQKDEDTDKDTDKNIPGDRNQRSACYPGSQLDNSACLPTTAKNELGNHHGDYRYLNPFSDSRFPRNFDPNFYVGPNHFIDLWGVDTSFNLGPDFTISEFLRQSSGRYGVYSTFTLAIVQEMRTLAGVPFRVNSGYRSPGHNSGINGSARWSRHMYGDALDFASREVSLNRLMQLCKDFGATFRSKYRTHVHCDWRYSERDPAFYSHQPQIPKHVELANLLSNDVKIHIGVNSDRVDLFTTHHSPEDGEGLAYEWAAQGPNDFRASGEDSNFSIVPTQPGVYDVQVIIGGTVTANTRFSWPADR